MDKENKQQLSPEQALLIVEIVTSHLRKGAIISAVNKDGRILETLPDGSIHGGLNIEYPPDKQN